MSASDIILARLKTHPEEFMTLAEGVNINGKWAPLLESLSDWATPEESREIADGMIQARRLLADQVALQILSGEYVEPPTLKYEHPYNTQTQVEQTQMKRMMDIQREYAKLAGGIVK